MPTTGVTQSQELTASFQKANESADIAFIITQISKGEDNLVGRWDILGVAVCL